MRNRDPWANEVLQLADARDTETLWSWALSQVVRVMPPDGSSVIVKRARGPLTDEARILEGVARHGAVPVPALYWASLRDGQLTMILEDLGPGIGDIGDDEAASLAVAIHATPFSEGLPVLDQDGLLGLFSETEHHLDRLRRRPAWTGHDDIQALLHATRRTGERLAITATEPPFGLVHSEFHPTSLHVGAHRTAVVDWARAFTGPGVLDLVSFQGTRSAPDIDACAAMLDLYRSAGGVIAEDHHRRTGVTTEQWAIFWHRIWIVAWFVASSATWMENPDLELLTASTVHKHLTEALTILETS